MSQNNSRAFKFAPAETEEKRVELSFDGDTTVIKLSSWVDGLGWCGEKTLSVDPEMLDDLHRMIGAARVRLRQDRSETGGTDITPSKVLSFPVAA